MKKLFLGLSLLVVLSLIWGAVGCGGSATPTPAPSLAPTVAPAVSATPRPATPSPTPAAGVTPAPSAAPTSAPASATPSVAPTSAPAGTPRATSAASPTPTPKPIIFKLAMSDPETSRRGPQVKKFKELLEKYTGGRYQMELYMGAILFAPAAQWEAVLTGAVDMVFTSPFYATTAVPQNWLWFLFPGVWEGVDHGFSVLKDGRVAKLMHDKTAEKNVEQLGIFPFSVAASILTKREIKSFSDLANMKLGLASAPPAIWTQYAKAKIVIVTAQEQYLAVSQGIIDGYLGTPSVTVGLKMWEVTSYHFIYPSGFNSTMMWMNKNKWNGLPADVRDIILNKVVPETQEFSYAQVAELEKKDLDTINSHVKAFHNVTVEDLQAARDFLKDDPTFKRQVDFVGPEIMSIVDELRPSNKAK